MDTEKEQPISDDLIGAYLVKNIEGMSINEIKEVFKETKIAFRRMRGELEQLREGELEFDRSPMKLGSLIHQLETFEEDRNIRFDFGGQPGNLHSYRGYYDHLAVSKNGPDSYQTVGEFREALLNVKGRHLTGYKGGQFLMTENVPVWVADRGSSTRISLCDIYDPEYGYLVILTSYYEW